MKKRTIKISALILALVLCFTIGAAASGQLQQISAYLNYGIKLKYDGQEQTMFDANGVRVYPITYNGTTYLPVRAVAGLFGESVDWDAANNTVLLGKSGEWADFIEILTPEITNQAAWCYKLSDGKKLEIGDQIYNNYLYLQQMNATLTYNLEGKYETIEFKACTLEDFVDCQLLIYGDNDEILKDITVKVGDLPVTVTLDVKDVNQLQIATSPGNWGSAFLFDMKIK